MTEVFTNAHLDNLVQCLSAVGATERPVLGVLPGTDTPAIFRAYLPPRVEQILPGGHAGVTAVFTSLEYGPDNTPSVRTGRHTQPLPQGATQIHQNVVEGTPLSSPCTGPALAAYIASVTQNVLTFQPDAIAQ